MTGVQSGYQSIGHYLRCSHREYKNMSVPHPGRGKNIFQQKAGTRIL
jgi:hypothetical protein